MKRYTLADFETEEKPRIQKGTFAFGAVVYLYKCSGRGSVGYGTTALHAFSTWQGNWRRRRSFYAAREEHAKKIIQLYGIR